MVTRWIPVSGYEERYRVGDSGVVESLAFPQRYLLRLNKQAVPVFDLATGDEFSSITQAAKTLRRNHRTIAKTFGRADE